MQFYPGDWRKDPAVACLSLPARGLWFEMLLLMHESPERGYLCYGTGTPISIEQLARMTGAPCAEVKRCVNEMDAAATFSRNEDGVIFCRRMVRDEKLCQIRRESGSKGGNPKLVQNYNSPGHLYLAKRTRDGAVKIGIAKDPAARVSKLRATQADPYIELLRVFEVGDMANAEKACHSHFAQFRMDGEWFNLQKEKLCEIDKILTGFLKQKPTPSSSSSSSSSNTPPNPQSQTTNRKMELDEQWTTFFTEWTIAGFPQCSGTDWSEARTAWNPLDFEQKLAAIKGIRARAGVPDDSARKSLPKNYIQKRMWERGIVAPKHNGEAYQHPGGLAR